MRKNKRIETVACSNLAAIEQELYCNYTVIIQELDNSNAQVLLTLNKSMSNSQAVPGTIKKTKQWCWNVERLEFSIKHIGNAKDTKPVPHALLTWKKSVSG